MPLESAIEARAVKELAKLGYPAIKVGFDGWPDRCVLYAPERCIWLEFKQPTGAKRKSQSIRARELRRIGHEVHFPDSWKDAVGLVAKARRQYDAQKA